MESTEPGATKTTVTVDEPASPSTSTTDESDAKQAAATPQEKPQSQEDSRRRKALQWTLRSFFDFNPTYLIQMRGIMNIIHMVLSLSTVILLTTTCQLRSYPDGPSEGFFCKPPETFLFIATCASFLTSLQYLFCCLLSKRTEALLFHTSYEICYFILYFILLLTSSIALMISTLNWGSERVLTGGNYERTQYSAISGLLASVFYGASSIWFFISHRYYDNFTQLVSTVRNGVRL